MRSALVRIWLPGLLIFLLSCSSGKKTAIPPGMADTLEESLFTHLLAAWYPRNIDSLNGGYISAFTEDWQESDGDQKKALVQQARHLWATAYVFEHYPEQGNYLDYAHHGYRFLRDKLYDQHYGGFLAFCAEDGSPLEEVATEKRIYGHAFVIYALAQYYRVSQNIEALELAKKTFLWMEEHAHDSVHGGYFEHLWRSGKPMQRSEAGLVKLGDEAATGLKDFNSSIHLMEALTELYRVWPDHLVHARLEEMFHLIRDVFVHPDGYLQLYFYPDWQLVPAKVMQEASPDNYWYTPHITYGHDVETAFLLVETAHVLGLEDDTGTQELARKLVDHSLASGWDYAKGGFYDAGKYIDGSVQLIKTEKSWWGLAEGLNALLLMHTLYPEETIYGQRFMEAWEHIDCYLIDKEHGGWYGASLDSDPESRDEDKSHTWKTSYHNTRAMVNCIRMLRED